MIAALFLVAMSLDAPVVPVTVVDSVPNACLSAEETHDAVGARLAVAPTMAHRHAREAVAGEILRMRLCRIDGALVYQVTVLRRDGRVARVSVEAASGKVAEVR